MERVAKDVLVFEDEQPQSVGKVVEILVIEASVVNHRDFDSFFPIRELAVCRDGD